MKEIMESTEYLLPVTAEPAILSVSALNQAVARMLERTFPLIWVAGEISNFTRAASGHWYFTLKDEGAQVRSVMFRGRAQYADFMPREGDKVEVRALPTMYAPRGEYQLSVEAIRRAGVGNLYEAFMRLKERLASEGLFDQARKRPLPVFAKTIGVVTSLQAAALRDILAALRRRAPHTQVIVYPAPVQGDGAAARIAQAIALASERAECGVLLVCRGGGSIEDLWAFNEEVVARAIAACAIPVISGVGHETDFTIADFAADLRAPTPTAAAELAATPLSDWVATLALQAGKLTRAMHRQLDEAQQSLDWQSRRLISPSAYIAHERLKLTGIQTRLTQAQRNQANEARYALSNLRTRLAARHPDFCPQREHLGEAARRIASAMTTRQATRRQALAALSAQLELLNPQRTLERGYAILTDQRGRILRSPAQLQPREPLNVRLAEGAAEVSIAGVQPMLE